MGVVRTILAFWLSLYVWVSYAQPVNRVPDSLLFSVRQVCFDTVAKTICRFDRSATLQYDFSFQYPYYVVDDRKWYTGDRVQLVFDRFPTRGQAYVFVLDGENNAQIFPILRKEAMSDTPFIYPGPLGSISLNHAGNTFICIWYSTDSLERASQRMAGIEMTRGSIVKRNLFQLGDKLLFPSYGWHLSGDRYGFITQPDLFGIPDSFVLPIILELKVSGKNRGKRGR